jgi:hypothetical protein
MIHRKTIFFVFTILISASCSSDNELCTCIAKGDELNKFSNSLLFSDEITSEQEGKLQQLRKETDKICEPFKEMNPDELRRLRMECPDALKDEESQQ